VLFSLFTNVFAANIHLHPKANTASKKSNSKSLTYPGPCELEIINDSFTDVNVYGLFDDYTSISFNIYRFESPHYISLYYGNYNPYCHSGMYLTITSPYNTVYNGWANVHSTIRIVPYLKQSKAVVTPR
jgi:hypothetical protein